MFIDVKQFFKCFGLAPGELARFHIESIKVMTGNLFGTVLITATACTLNEAFSKFQIFCLPLLYLSFHKFYDALLCIEGEKSSLVCVIAIAFPLHFARGPK